VPRLFALDQNFPQPIVALLAEYLTEKAKLVPLGDIDNSASGHRVFVPERLFTGGR